MSLKAQKKLKLNEILLLSLAGTLDFLAEIKDPLGLYSSYYQNFYGYVPNKWKKQNFFRLVKNQIKNKTIEKVKFKNKEYFKITNKGIDKLRYKFAIYTLNNNSWDGAWRIVIFDIQELRKNLRDSFRRNLKSLGFGQLQKSVWISPYPVFEDINKFIKENNLSNEVIVFETRKISLSNQIVAEKAWNLKELEESYINSYITLNELSNKLKLETQKNLFKEFKKNHKNVLDIYFTDPQLPTELLTVSWPKNKVVKLLKKLSKYFNKQI